MKIAVMNFSGNVGKSTISRHLLASRINANVISVESINSDGENNDDAVRGKNFQELMDILSLSDSLVVDVGASNVEDFITRMQAYKGSHDDFDLYVIPTVSKNKQMKDTISTVETLSEIGVPPEKIRLVFNMVEADEDPSEVFAGLITYAEQTGRCQVSPNMVIRSNELFGKLRKPGSSVEAILADETDYKAEIKAATDPVVKVQLSQALGLKRLAAGVKEELDRVFIAVVGA